MWIFKRKQNGFVTAIDISSILAIILAAGIIITFINAIVWSRSVSASISYLKNNGYTVLLTSEYNTINTKLDLIQAEGHSVYLSVSNETFIFPEETNVKVTLTAGGVANTFGNWVEIVDSNAVSLSSKFTTQAGHLAEINTEDYSITHKRYMIEIAYGDTKEVIARTRVKAEQLGATPFVYYLELRSKEIPAGETIYYRMKAETAGATLECSFRYYYR